MHLGEHGPVNQGHAISIPASVVFMADAFLELYLHYRKDRPALEALLAEGEGADAAIPDVDIYEDTHSSLSKGWWSAMQSDAGLEERMHKLRADFNTRVHGRYDVLEFVRQNQADWQEACETLTGDATAVPYVWAKILATLEQKPDALDALVNRKKAVEVAAPAARL